MIDDVSIVRVGTMYEEVICVIIDVPLQFGRTIICRCLDLNAVSRFSQIAH